MITISRQIHFPIQRLPHRSMRLVHSPTQQQSPLTIYPFRSSLIQVRPAMYWIQQIQRNQPAMDSNCAHATEHCFLTILRLSKLLCVWSLMFSSMMVRRFVPNFSLFPGPSLYPWEKKLLKGCKYWRLSTKCLLRLRWCRKAHTLTNTLVFVQEQESSKTNLSNCTLTNLYLQ